METYWLELGIGVLCVLWWLYSWTVERRLDTMRERYFEMVDCQQQLRDRLLALEHPPLRRDGDAVAYVVPAGEMPK